jgi:hypothetical protein
MALTLQQDPAEGLPIANWSKVRTEIVLSDARDVAFWFSFAYGIRTFKQAGKPVFTIIHQTHVTSDTLFPKRREYDEKLKVEDENRNQD